MYVNLKGLHTVKKKGPAGTATYYYAWRGGPRIHSQFGTPQFIAEFSAKVAERRQPAGGTMFSLIAEYKASGAFHVLRDSTRRDYLRYLKEIEKEFGTLPIAAIEDSRIRTDLMDWRDKMAATPRAADLAWAVLARVLKVAKDRGRIRANPCERAGRLYKADRTDALWTEEMIEAVRVEFPPQLRWAFTLALYTGQRQGDLLRLPWSAVVSGRIRLRQSKTQRRINIPVAATLKEELGAIPKHSPIILTSQDKRPWTSDGFRASWRRACKEAGISGVTFHDLRGSAVTKLAEAGCSVPEIATITGHSLDDVGAILDAHYLSRTNTLGDSAIRKLDRKERRTKSVKTGVNRSDAE